HGVAVNGHRVFDVVRIAAGVGDHHGYVACARGPEDKLVALLQPRDGQIQSAKLVVGVRIGARNVADQLRLKQPQTGTQSVIEPGQIFDIAAAIGQVDVDGRWRLDEG